MRLPFFDTEDEPEISMSPLIDAVFLLLIFFLVSSVTKVKNRDIDVDLPTSEAAIKMKPDDKQAIVGIDIDGHFYWDGEPCTTNFLMEQLRTVSILNRIVAYVLIWIEALLSEDLWKLWMLASFTIYQI